MSQFFSQSDVLVVGADGSFVGIDDCAQAPDCGCGGTPTQGQCCNGYLTGLLFCNDLPAGGYAAQYKQNITSRVNVDSNVWSGGTQANPSHQSNAAGTIDLAGVNIQNVTNAAGSCASVPARVCVATPALFYTITEHLRDPNLPVRTCDINNLWLRESWSLGSVINDTREGESATVPKMIDVGPERQHYFRFLSDPADDTLWGEYCPSSAFSSINNLQRYQQKGTVQFVSGNLQKSLEVYHDNGAREFYQKARTVAILSGSSPPNELGMYSSADILLDAGDLLETNWSVDWSDPCCDYPSMVRIYIAEPGSTYIEPGSVIDPLLDVFDIMRAFPGEEYFAIEITLIKTPDSTSSYTLSKVMAFAKVSYSGVEQTINAVDITSSCSASVAKPSIIHGSPHPTLGGAGSNDLSLVFNVSYSISGSFGNTLDGQGGASLTTSVVYTAGPSTQETSIMSVCPETVTNQVNACTGSADEFILPVPGGVCSPGWVNVTPTGSTTSSLNKIIIGASFGHRTYEVLDASICQNQFLWTESWGSISDPNHQGFRQPLQDGLFGGCLGIDTTEFGLSYNATKDTFTYADCNNRTTATTPQNFLLRLVSTAKNTTAVTKLIGLNSAGEPTYEIPNQYDLAFGVRIGNRFRGPQYDTRPIVLVSGGVSTSFGTSITTYDQWRFINDPANQPFSSVSVFATSIELFKELNLTIPTGVAEPTPEYTTTNAIRGIRIVLTERKALKSETLKYYEVSTNITIMFHGDEANWFNSADPERFYIASGLGVDTYLSGCVRPSLFLPPPPLLAAESGFSEAPVSPALREFYDQQLKLRRGPCRGGCPD